MKDEPWRRRLDAYDWQTELWPRFSDVDTLAHLNNVALIGLHSEALMRWHGARLGQEHWRHREPLLWPVALATDFLQQAHYGAEPLRAGVRLLGLDGRQWRVAGALFQGDVCVGLHEARLACWNEGVAAPLPEAVAAALRSGPGQLDELPMPMPMPVPMASPRREDYAEAQRLQARYADLDAHHCVAALAFARYAEQSRSRLLNELVEREMPDEPLGFLVAHVGLRDLAPVRGSTSTPMTWQIAHALGRLGGSSLQLRTAIFDGVQCRAVSDCVLVTVDPATRRPRPLPNRLRELLQRLLPPTRDASESSR